MLEGPRDGKCCLRRRRLSDGSAAELDDSDQLRSVAQSAGHCRRGAAVRTHGHLRRQEVEGGELDVELREDGLGLDEQRGCVGLVGLGLRESGLVGLLRGDREREVSLSLHGLVPHTVGRGGRHPYVVEALEETVGTGGQDAAELAEARVALLVELPDHVIGALLRGFRGVLGLPRRVGDRDALLLEPQGQCVGGRGVRGPLRDEGSLLIALRGEGEVLVKLAGRGQRAVVGRERRVRGRGGSGRADRGRRARASARAGCGRRVRRHGYAGIARRGAR